MTYTTHHGKRVSPAHRVMLRAWEEEHNRTLYINQGARTLAEQAHFYWLYKFRGGNVAARPWPPAPHIKYGKQHHANDINADVAQSVAAFYRKHGVPVAFNVSGEPWHMDTLDEAKLIAAAARLGKSILPVLQRGQTGRSVVKLKKLLYDKGIRFFSGKNSSNRYIPYFGSSTKDAVQRFQKKHGLKADGEVGNSTWEELLK